eukprot:gb/GEZN01003354.1/.p1 GENE.gb/GEZN01003354.1/~~gb/GEZN01003354.1/.p1  ORF type:complete len:586 (+),score=106.85 gb/GEZN01003354.1/:82-1758(+)
MNFARRDKCFQCGVPQGPDATYVSQEPNATGLTPGVKPNSVLVIRNMDPNTTEHTVRYIFSGFVPQGVKDVRVIMDKDAGTSRGLCYVDFFSPEDATVALGQSVGLRIDNAVVRVSFARNNEHNGIDGQWERGRGRGQKVAPKRPPNIAPTFKWDPQSGYWFDVQTGFYYDTTSHLYYHSATGIYYRWDVTSQQYVQVDSRGVKVDPSQNFADPFSSSSSIPIIPIIASPYSSSTSDASSSAAAAPAPQPTPAPVPVSIPVIAAPPQPTAVDEAAKAAVIQELSQSISLAFKAVGKKKKKTSKTIQPVAMQVEAADEQVVPPPLDDVTPPALPPPGESLAPDKWVNASRNQCLLCKRQFKDVEQLTKHVQKSALHKKNLEVEMYKEIQVQARKEADTKVAAHRAETEAARRRTRVFEDMVQSAAKKTAEEKRTKPIESSNKGNKMLKAMGWKEGQGLGKDGTGIVAPVAAVMHDKAAGIGASVTQDAMKAGAQKTEGGGSGYNSVVNREKARARYGQFNAAVAQNATAAPVDEYMQMMAQFKSSACDDDEYGHRALLK